MTTVYVAGPMSGYPGHNYHAFNEAAAALRARGLGVLNPVDVDNEGDEPGAHPWDWYMRRALRMLTEADAVAVLPGWEQSKGARLEVRVAHGLGMRVSELAEWLDRCADEVEAT